MEWSKEIKLMENYLFRFFQEIQSIEFRIEELRINLVTSKQFEDKQVFNYMLGDEYGTGQEFLEEKHIERFFQQFSKMTIFKREIEYFLIYFSDMNNYTLSYDNYLDIFIPHSNETHIQKIQERIKKEKSKEKKDEYSMNSAPSNEQAIILAKILDCEVLLFRRMEKYRRELFKIFGWNLLEVPLVKQKKITFQDFQDFMTKHDDECEIHEAHMDAAFRRLFYNNRRYYQFWIFKDLKKFIFPSDYMSKIEILKDPYNGFELTKQKMHHQEYAVNLRKDDYNGNILQAQTNFEWQENDYLPKYIKFYNNVDDIKPKSSDIFVQEYQKFLSIQEKRNKEQKINEILHKNDTLFYKPQIKNIPKTKQEKQLKKIQAYTYYTCISKMNNSKK